MPLASPRKTNALVGGLTLEGAVVEQDKDSTKAIYGDEQGFRAELSGRIPPPPPAADFLKEVTAQAVRAHEENK